MNKNYNSMLKWSTDLGRKWCFLSSCLLRDVRRLVVAMSRARLGLYIFARVSLFQNCYELTPAFSQLTARPLQLHIRPHEYYRSVSTAGTTLLSARWRNWDCSIVSLINPLQLSILVPPREKCEKTVRGEMIVSALLVSPSRPAEIQRFHPYTHLARLILGFDCKRAHMWWELEFSFTVSIETQAFYQSSPSKSPTSVYWCFMEMDKRVRVLFNYSVVYCI